MSVSCGPDRRLRHWCSSIYLRISPLHMEFHDPLPHSSRPVSMAYRSLASVFHHRPLRPPAPSLRPMIPDNARHLRITRGCWHVVSRGFLVKYRHCIPFPVCAVLPLQQSFTTRRPSSLTRRCSVRVSPIAENSLLLPPVGVWAVSQSQCGRPPSQAGYASLPWWAVAPPTS